MQCREIVLLARAAALTALAVLAATGTVRAQAEVPAPGAVASQAPSEAPAQNPNPEIAPGRAPGSAIDAPRVPAPLPAAVQPTRVVEPLKARYQLRVMEGVLENAVQHGIRSVGAQMRVVTPDLIFFGSPARARGFRLEGFGAFFDVDVPTLRPSVAWSVRTLSQNGPDMMRALQSLRRTVESQGDERARRESEQALRLIELQVGPVREDSPGGAQQAPPVEPAAAYETEVKRALVEAMLDYGNTITLGDGDWLAVAARANDAMGQDALDNVTVLLKIRGSDLQALRVGTLSRDDARQRVSITEF